MLSCCSEQSFKVRITDLTFFTPLKYGRVWALGIELQTLTFPIFRMQSIRFNPCQSYLKIFLIHLFVGVETG